MPKILGAGTPPQPLGGQSWLKSYLHSRMARQFKRMGPPHAAGMPRMRPPTFAPPAMLPGLTPPMGADPAAPEGP